MRQYDCNRGGISGGEINKSLDFEVELRQHKAAINDFVVKGFSECKKKKKTDEKERVLIRFAG